MVAAKKELVLGREYITQTVTPSSEVSTKLVF